MNISAIIAQLSELHQLYGDLPVYQVTGQTYEPMQQFPWLAAPSGAVPNPTNYIVCFGQLASPPPVLFLPQE